MESIKTLSKPFNTWNKDNILQPHYWEYCTFIYTAVIIERQILLKHPTKYVIHFLNLCFQVNVARHWPHKLAKMRHIGPAEPSEFVPSDHGRIMANCQTKIFDQLKSEDDDDDLFQLFYFKQLLLSFNRVARFDDYKCTPKYSIRM